MKLALMQPYFFPYLGYFDLIDRVDRWIVFDTAQYINRGWVNRNRILHPQQGWQYIIVPLRKHRLETPICEIETLPPGEWQPRLLGQLAHYKKRAPFFGATMELVRACLDSSETNLSRLNTRILGLVCGYLGIRWQPATASEHPGRPAAVDAPDEWALQLALAERATEYINPPGGATLYDAAKFSAHGVTLTIQPSFTFAYETPGYTFEPGLSVIDAMMWNSPAAIKAHLTASRGPTA